MPTTTVLPINIAINQFLLIFPRCYSGPIQISSVFDQIKRVTPIKLTIIVKTYCEKNIFLSFRIR